MSGSLFMYSRKFFWLPIHSRIVKFYFYEQFEDFKIIKAQYSFVFYVDGSTPKV